jgi:hypothetical protein
MVINEFTTKRGEIMDVKLPILRSLKRGQKIIFLTAGKPGYAMGYAETLRAKGYGRWKQTAVTVIIENSEYIRHGILIECIDPVPPMKRRGRPKGKKGKDHAGEFIKILREIKTKQHPTIQTLTAQNHSTTKEEGK